jgi:hypothetical protein
MSCYAQVMRAASRFKIRAAICPVMFHMIPARRVPGARTVTCSSNPRSVSTITPVLRQMPSILLTLPRIARPEHVALTGALLR